MREGTKSKAGERRERKGALGEGRAEGRGLTQIFT